MSNNLIKQIQTKRRKSELKIEAINDDPIFKNYKFNDLVNSQLVIEAFNIFDTDRTNDLDKREFKKLLSSLGKEYSDRKLGELYNIVDSDKSGTVDLNEFHSMMIEQGTFNIETPVRLILERCFDCYDRDCDGFIDNSDIKIAGDEFEDFINTDELEVLVQIIKDFAAQSNIDGNLHNKSKISKEEFVNAMVKMQFVTEINVKKENGNDLQQDKIEDNLNVDIKKVKN
jgi:Ca2+-binding EF-hand superfamily protein